MESQQQGEQMHVLNPAGLLPIRAFHRPLFAGGGLAAGLALGIAIAIWLEIRDRSIRTEKDAAVAWICRFWSPCLGFSEDEPAMANGNGGRHFWDVETV